MALDPKSRPYTAFTVPGMGQFEWKVVSMGLASAPSAFQRLIEQVVKGIDNVVVYIDDLIIHSRTHEDHLKMLNAVFTRLASHDLRVNLKKCVFGSSETSYLGFQLSKEGIFPRADKLKAVKEALPPENVKQIRQFLGLCNFFRGHIQNFAQITLPLTQLTKRTPAGSAGLSRRTRFVHFAICNRCCVQNRCWPTRGRIGNMRSLQTLPLGKRTRRVAWGPS
jgi:hypothetical protein